MRALAGVRNFLSNTTRASGRGRKQSRTVKIGSSARSVPEPTPTASTDARKRWVRRLASGELIWVRIPAAAAMRPSIVVATFAITIGRPCVCTMVKARFRRSACSWRSPTSTSIPLARSSSKPLPLTRGLGSGIAATTLLMPDAITRRVHGPVRPVWQHGSSVTNIVAPRARSPASSSAKTSAWGSPARGCRPYPTTTPSGDTITAPTIGFGVVTATDRDA